ncbi:50S ribosomal protein L23 [Thermocrinis minervae]|uniref:Large ribosomal subunit protein uL23 n=1 Tax=Thermocrinis minervae TaxID=381751 RepID=A0A1M6RHN3_9AQUI|nr:50S ribosomal protein L23 [Thermocrinis minervae]SHK32011.1 LSU ribosomal protein L23P [Thermocrinis minervae]
MRRPEEIIIRPIITEKTNRLMEEKKYVFEVALDATKHEIKYAIEKLFSVPVLKVNTMIVKPKKKRIFGKITRRYGYTRKYKKAIVTIPPDKEIDLLSL